MALKSIVNYKYEEVATLHQKYYAEIVAVNTPA